MSTPYGNSDQKGERNQSGLGGKRFHEGEEDLGGPQRVSLRQGVCGCKLFSAEEKRM